MAIHRRIVLALFGAVLAVPALALAQTAGSGAHVIVHGRNQERGKAVVDEIAKEGRGTAKFYAADLGSLAEVHFVVNYLGQSKLAQILFTVDLADELKGRNVVVTALHPATMMDTSMVRQSGMQARATVDEGATAVSRLRAR